MDAITDLIQGGVLILGLLAIGALTLLNLGGPSEALTAVAESGRVVSPSDVHPGLLAGLEAWAIPVCGSVVATELVGRVIGARSADVARRSSLAAGGLYLLVGLIPVFVGITGAGLALDLAHPEQLLPTVAQTQLPPIAYAVFAGGLLSAILSTVDSTLLISSGLLSHNVIVPALRDPSERVKVLLARGGVLTFGIIAYGLALRAEGVLDLVEQASAFGSAGALVTVSFGLFTRFGGPRAALATLIAGVVAYLVGVIAAWPYPFLFSLASSLGTYVAIGVAEYAQAGGMRRTAA